MKKLALILLQIIFISASIFAVPDAMTITVEATTGVFQNKSFANGTVAFTNRTYVLSGIPTDFAGYEFLSSNGGTSNDGLVAQGTIIPSSAGTIYIIALTGVTISGWTLVPGTDFTYPTTGTAGKLSIYQRTVTAGERVPIPIVDNFQEAKPIAKKINLIDPTPVLEDQMSVTLEILSGDEANFSSTIFANNALFVTNRTYTMTNIPAAFQGYTFMSNAGAKVDEGIVIPSADGYIYIIAETGTVEHWTIIENSGFLYNNTGLLSIYKKAVKAGERVEIPLLTNFEGATLIAKNITTKIVDANKDARLQSMSVDGVKIESFNKEIYDYDFYLPYTYTKFPDITLKGMSDNATFVVSNVEQLKGTEDERTATIVVTAGDGVTKSTYKVMFEVLPPLDLFLCIGQSNMSGAGPAVESLGDYDPIKNAFLFTTKGQFEQAKNIMNRYSNVKSTMNNISPSYSFAKSIASRTYNSSGFVVNSRGATTIENWTKGGTGAEADTLYAATMRRALEAKKWGNFKAIIWHQGEYNKFDTIAYPDKLKKLVTDLRTDLGDNQLLFVAGQIGAWRTDFSSFNNMIINVSTFIDNATCVSSQGLTHTGDNTHFNRESSITLGQRYAQAVADRIYKPDEMSVTVEADYGIFEKKDLVKDVTLFTNRPTYLITNSTFSGFDGYQFLISEAAVTEAGVMIPSADGFVYILAKSGLSFADWTSVFGTAFFYGTTEMAIYQRKAKAGERILIPTTTDFRGICPVAKTISLNLINPQTNAKLSNILIDGNKIVSFNKEILTNSFYLPYNYANTPTILPEVIASGATYSIVNPTNVKGTADERTATITVKSPDLSVTLDYKVVFEVLPELDLFLCIGQSNMAGAAPMDASKGDLNPVEKAFLFNSSNQFEAAKNGMNRYSNIASTASQNFGLTFPFAKKIVAQTGKTIGFVVNARGGSSIELWEKGGTDAGDSLYVHTLTRALEAQKWGTYKAILWHQGEANKNASAAYPAKLTQLVSNLRTDLNSPQLLFVAGQIGQWNTANAPFNSMITTISSFVNNSACALSDGLINITNLADMDAHFNRDGLILFGERYANIVLQKQYGIGTDTKFQSAQNLSLYAVNKQLHINGLSEDDTTCTVFDITGKKVIQQKVKGTSVINIAKKGMYIVSLTNTQIRKTTKIIIK